MVVVTLVTFFIITFIALCIIYLLICTYCFVALALTPGKISPSRWYIFTVYKEVKLHVEFINHCINV